MWPNLMGPGWQPQLLLAVGMLCAIIAASKALAAAADRWEAEEAPGPLLGLWHRYEEGNLTRQEFERAKRALREPSARAQANHRPRTEVHHVPAS
jgi:hypothetical protein